MKADIVYRERLLRLAAFLEALPRPELFNFGTWVNMGNTGEEIPASLRDVDMHTCKTTACAIGWATAVPEFYELGIRFNQYGEPCLEGRETTTSETHIGMEVFGLYWNETDFLFFPDSASDPEPSEDYIRNAHRLPASATAVQVAARIRYFVEKQTRMIEKNGGREVAS